MRTSRGWWWLSGVVVGALGLAVSYLVAGVMGIREWPVVAVGETIRDLSPQGLVEWAKETFGTADKLVVIFGIFVFLVIASSRRSDNSPATHWWVAVGRLGRPGGDRRLSVVTRPTFVNEQLAPVIVGFLAWLIALAVIAGGLRRWELVDMPPRTPTTDPTHSRRGFFVAVGAVGGLAIVSAHPRRFVGNPREAGRAGPAVAAGRRGHQADRSRAARSSTSPAIRPWQTRPRTST